jgi:hypothetical protein
MAAVHNTINVLRAGRMILLLMSKDRPTGFPFDASILRSIQEAHMGLTFFEGERAWQA